MKNWDIDKYKSLSRLTYHQRARRIRRRADEPVSNHKFIGSDLSYSSKSQYWGFIQDYADNQYYEDCIAWGKFVDSKCENLTDKEKEHLSQIFEKASILELNFWKMADRG